MLLPRTSCYVADPPYLYMHACCSRHNTLTEQASCSAECPISNRRRRRKMSKGTTCEAVVCVIADTALGEAAESRRGSGVLVKGPERAPSRSPKGHAHGSPFPLLVRVRVSFRDTIIP